MLTLCSATAQVGRLLITNLGSATIGHVFTISFIYIASKVIRNRFQYEGSDTKNFSVRDLKTSGFRT